MCSLARRSGTTGQVARASCETPRQPTLLALPPRVASGSAATGQPELHKLLKDRPRSPITAVQAGRSVLVGSRGAALSGARRRDWERPGVVLDWVARAIRQARRAPPGEEAYRACRSPEQAGNVSKRATGGAEHRARSSRAPTPAPRARAGEDGGCHAEAGRRQAAEGGACPSSKGFANCRFSPCAAAAPMAGAPQTPCSAAPAWRPVAPSVTRKSCFR